MRISRPQRTASSVSDTDVCTRYAAGEGLETLARATGLSPHGVRKVLQAHDVVLRRPGWPPRKPRGRS